jgi:hypothetical protein
MIFLIMSHNLVNKFGLHPPSPIQSNKKNWPSYLPIQTFKIDDLIHKNMSRNLPSNLALQPNIHLYGRREREVVSHSPSFSSEYEESSIKRRTFSTYTCWPCILIPYKAHVVWLFYIHGVSCESMKKIKIIKWWWVFLVQNKYGLNV